MTTSRRALRRIPCSPGRHETLDVARGVAVLGILWFNIFLFALPFEAMVIPGIWGEANTANMLTWEVMSVTVAGVMRGMFSILFGASALLLLARAEGTHGETDAIDGYFRRLVWLIAIGSVHAYLLIWPHDILYAYGVLGMLIFPFRHARAGTLIVVAGAMLLGSTVLTARNVEEIGDARTKVDRVLPEPERERLRGGDPLVEELESYDESSWRGAHPRFLLAADADPATPDGERIDREYDEFVARLAGEMDERQKGYLANLVAFAPDSFEQQTAEMISNHLLDVGAFLFFGMALFKLGFLTGKWDGRAYARVAVVGYAVGLTIGVVARVPTVEGTTFDAVSHFASSYGFDVRRLALALANFASVALLVRSGHLGALRRRLAACGRMALTLYISQTVICNFVFLGYGLAQFGQLEHHQIALVALALTLAQLAVAPMVLARWRQGPLEALLRRVVAIGADDRPHRPIALPPDIARP